ncbi:MAG: CPBP family intramembrane metalloprotease [Syntrophomonadaceae bacterium]|nr:CPBP family intramembrane metalloprotease [Syntrophomonadaceae bacterium]
MHDHALKPRWGLIDIVIVYAGAVLFTLFAGRGLAQIISDPMTLFVAGALLQFLIITGLVLLFTLYINQARAADLGIKKPSGQQLLVYGVLGGAVLMVLMMLLGIPIALLQPEVQPQLFEQMLRGAGQDSSFLILLFLGVVTAPISEELFYRGMIYPFFRGYLGPSWAAILAGLVFGLAHWDLWRTIPLAVGGALLCVLYQRTGNLWVTIVAHGTWNGLMSLLVYYNFLV